jgi:hypothetical protein
VACARNDISAKENIRPPTETGFVDFAFPIREGKVAHLVLPPDLKLAEVGRLTAYLSTLTTDFDPTKSNNVNP